MKKTRKTDLVTKIVKGRVYHYYRVVTYSDGRRQEKHIRIKADPGTEAFDGTKKKYRPILDDLRIKSGDVAVTLVNRSEIEAIHEKSAATPRMADHRVRVLRILFEHAKRLEWMTHNPASGIELFGRKREFKPWPYWMIDKLPTAPFIVRLARLSRTRGQTFRPTRAPQARDRPPRRGRVDRCADPGDDEPERGDGRLQSPAGEPQTPHRSRP